MSGAEIDHLVVWAPTLEAGCAWCEATLGVSPGPGGNHPLMGTHNRLLSLSSPEHPRSYLEIIAVNPAQPEPVPPRLARWFDMDDLPLRARVAAEGPQLVHLVARVPHLSAALAALQAQGIDRGLALAATRQTPNGSLKWRIAVRDDGQRLFEGALPTLIEWEGPHPADALPDSGLRLRRLELSSAHPELAAALDAIGLAQLYSAVHGAPALRATIDSPRGRVDLRHHLPDLTARRT